MAWLNATPETEQKKGEARRETKSRQQQLADADIEPDMPDLDWGKYLVDYLFEVGPVMAAGMGSAPISFTELACWQSQMGLRLTPWEARTMRRLSSEYCSESHHATQPNREAPFVSRASIWLHNAKYARDLGDFLDG